MASWAWLSLVVAMMGEERGPVVELPAEPGAAEAPGWSLSWGSGTVPDNVLVRGYQDLRLRAPGTTIGSYGQFNLEYVRAGDGPYAGTADLKRLVVFVSHHFSETVRAYMEIEYEHAVACAHCLGEVEVEQGFVDWDLLDQRLTLRTGLILIPIGITNQWHEPPVFHGVNRPQVEISVIPSTWRELGMGITGRLGSVWRYELYAMTAPDAVHLGVGGLRGASDKGSFVPAGAWMLAGRVEAEPVLGAVTGLSLVGGDMGDDVRFYDAAHVRRRLHAPLFGVAFDARWRRLGVEARTVGATFWLPGAGEMLTALNADGNPWYDPAAQGAIATFMYGAYVEMAYDVLHPLDVAHQLLPFVRVETYDTQARVPAGLARDGRRHALDISAGLSYRPVQQLVFKADARWVMREAGENDNRLDAGLGYMF